MDQLLHNVSQKIQNLTLQHPSHPESSKSNPSGNTTASELTASSDHGQSEGHLRQALPDFVFQAVDKYVDSEFLYISIMPQ